MEEFNAKSFEQIVDEKLGASYLYGEGRKYIMLRGVKVWKTPAERDNYLMTLQSAKRLGQSEVMFMGVSLPIDTAITIIDAVNVYAYAVTTAMETHEANIKALDSIEAVEAYDFTAGYPAILEF